MGLCERQKGSRFPSSARYVRTVNRSRHRSPFTVNAGGKPTGGVMGAVCKLWACRKRYAGVPSACNVRNGTTRIDGS